jgi:hypothetical protein
MSVIESHNDHYRWGVRVRGHFPMNGAALEAFASTFAGRFPVAENYQIIEKARNAVEKMARHSPGPAPTYY